MSRHENVVCRGCRKMGFSGRCYRCLCCPNFDICADCYDLDFTTESHLFDHPVKCVYTPTDVELYFGGEYISSDPPQSYRCPYCKLWGFNEATFLEHISGMHANASPLLVSTMITLFEQQQASRMFLENEQLASMAAAANSRNEQMNHTEGTLDLRLEPLNPDGSYRRENIFGAVTSDRRVLLRRPAAGSAELPDVTTRAGASGRRRSGPRAGLRFSVRTIDGASPSNGFHQSPPPASSFSGQHRMMSDMMRYYETTSLPNSRSTRTRHESFPQRPISDQRFGRPSARNFFLVDPPPTINELPGSGSGSGMPPEMMRWPAFIAAPPMIPSHASLDQAPRDLAANTLLSEDRDVITLNLSETLIQHLIAFMVKPPPKQKRDTRYLCNRFLSHEPPESHKQSAFLAHRAEFVSQLFASALHEEESPTQATQLQALPISDHAGAGDTNLSSQ
ncbi:E3 ubiquitin-protein ligase Kcmf1 [Drosophila guanche]|uniref:RING-type E3 ubiquitin transferase n=1 Tax=Drosophila guanche TaxID=7266 RepID=A0A3B0JJC1_DROGU|nr:E3 ubiquitin-protein ligase Kcmf1 [Drosophila guanche]SPP82484.1 blast:E3 ubiquitin-protein ligase KCMF1 [Drosophila guanche]